MPQVYRKDDWKFLALWAKQVLLKGHFQGNLSPQWGGSEVTDTALPSPTLISGDTNVKILKSQIEALHEHLDNFGYNFVTPIKDVWHQDNIGAVEEAIFTLDWASHTTLASHNNMIAGDSFLGDTVFNSEAQSLYSTTFGPGAGGLLTDVTDEGTFFYPISGFPTPFINWFVYIENWLIPDSNFSNQVFKGAGFNSGVIGSYPGGGAGTGAYSNDTGITRRRYSYKVVGFTTLSSFSAASLGLPLASFPAP